MIRLLQRLRGGSGHHHEPRRGLSQARPDLTGGIYAYASAGFGDYIGFNSAWGYWVSACFSNVSFAILFFGPIGAIIVNVAVMAVVCPYLKISGVHPLV